MNSYRVLDGCRVLSRASAVVALLAGPSHISAFGNEAAATASRAIPFAVIGDSDSQGFQDLARAGVNAAPRGGVHHATTLQWTEVLSRLRGGQFDLGLWGVHGIRGRVALALEALGLARVAASLGHEVRAPIKRDHGYNYAYSGDGCADLFGGWSRQVPRLVRMMDSDSKGWARGVVVIRIGGNDFGNDVPNLDRLAADPASPEVRRRMDFCLAEIRRAVALIHQNHPTMRVVLVGSFDTAHWERYLDHWRSAPMLANISHGLDYFDNELRRLTVGDSRLAFFDDRKWFASLWGSRGSDGLPNYRTLVLSPQIRVSNTGGDAPGNATLADGHAGLVWNAKWAQAMVALLNDRFDLGISPVGDAEIARFVVDIGAFKDSN